MDTQGLLEAVAGEFAATGAAHPPWPDPHPPGTSPREEEYSRCLNPGKYRIVAARADAWVRALRGLGLAVTEELEDPTAAWRERLNVPLETASRLRPLRAGAVSLLLGFMNLNGVSVAGVAVGAGEPAATLVRVPDCGCDACDTGSADMLDELDEHVLAVVNGEVVHVATRKGTIVATESGWSASGFTGGQREIETVLTEARAGRSRHRVVQGTAWT